MKSDRWFVVILLALCLGVVTVAVSSGPGEPGAPAAAGFAAEPEPLHGSRRPGDGY